MRMISCTAMMGTSAGRVTLSIWRKLPAPSMAAASYRLISTEDSVARYKILLQPICFQMPLAM